MHDSSALIAQTNPQTPAHTLRLILGDQLNAQHSWFATRDAGVVYVLMEVRQGTDYVLHHAQKVLAIFAAMRAFAAGLRRAGHRVRYVTIDNASNRQSIPHNLEALMAHYRAGDLEYQAPDEWRLDEALQHWSAAQPFATRMVDSEHFLTARNEVAACFPTGSPWRMEVFIGVCGASIGSCSMPPANRKAGAGTSITTIVRRGRATRLRHRIGARLTITARYGTRSKPPACAVLAHRTRKPCHGRWIAMRPCSIWRLSSRMHCPISAATRMR